MISLFFSVLVLNVFPGFWYLPLVAARIKYVPDFVMVCTRYVGNAMARNRLGVCPDPLASYSPAFWDKNESRNPMHGDDRGLQRDSTSKRKYVSCDAEFFAAVEPYPRPD